MLLIGSKKPLPHDKSNGLNLHLPKKLYYLRPVWANQREARRRRAAKPARANRESVAVVGSGMVTVTLPLL